jgi:adenylate kinase
MDVVHSGFVFPISHLFCYPSNVCFSQAKAYLDAGQFVPDQMVINFIKTRLSQPDVATHGCMLDGFPRTEKQARELEHHITIDRFVVLQVPDRALLIRVG